MATEPTTDAPDAAHRLVDARPDWDALEFELTCPRCDYNLRMLEQPRCPECGLEFDWAVLVDDRARSNPFLFEHNWRKRPIWSFLVTWFGAMRPRRFWKRVALHETPRVGPLIAVLVLSGLMAAMSSFVFSLLAYWVSAGAVEAARMFLPLELLRAQWLDRIREIRDFFGDLSGIGTWLDPELISALVFVFGSCLLGTFVFLAGLRQTLGRCRVRVVQILRVVGYAALGASTVTPIVLITSFCLQTVLNPPGNPFAWWREVFLLIPLWVPTLVLGAYISTGLGDYLRLPRPHAIGFVAAFTAILASMIGWNCVVMPVIDVLL